MINNRTIQTYNRIAPTYAQHNRDRRPLHNTYARFLALLEESEAAGRPYPILDIGCGPGYDCVHFRQKGWWTIGVDLSVAMIAAGRGMRPELQTADFVQADMGALPFGEASAAGIWMCASLLHIPRMQTAAVLGELARLLRPAGVLCISVKEGEGEAWAQTSYGEPEARFFTFWQPDELDQLLDEGGFAIIAGWKEPDVSRPLTWLVRLVQKQSN